MITQEDYTDLMKKEERDDEAMRFGMSKIENLKNLQ